MAKVYRINLLDLAVLAFSSAAAAADGSTGDHRIIADEAGMGVLDTKVIVQLYNKVRPERPIQKFADRATANKRGFQLLEYLADINPNKEETMTAKKKAPKGAKTPKTKSGIRGRQSAMAGKRLVPKGENPRREGTAAYKSFALLGRDGIAYEDFKKKGGRRQDLAWDIKHGHVKVVNG